MFKKLLLCISLGAVLLLTGCITIDIQNIIGADGSGEKVMITALDRDAYEMMMAMTPEPGEELEDPLEDLMAMCDQEPRATCEEYVDPEKELVGVRVSVPFGSLEELVALSDSSIFDGSDEITFERSGDATTMRITVYTEDVSSELAAGSGEVEATPMLEATLTPEEEEQMKQFLEMLDISFLYRVTAPAPVTSYEPTENATYDEAENTVTWEIDLLSEESSQELTLTWGGPPIEIEEEPTAEPTQEPTEEPSPAPTQEATEEPPPEATAVPTVPPLPQEEEGPGKLCPSCLPAISLPVIVVSGVLAAQRKRRV